MSACSIAFVVGAPSLDVAVELEPPRLTVGTKASGLLIAVNRSRRSRLSPPRRVWVALNPVSLFTS